MKDFLENRKENMYKYYPLPAIIMIVLQVMFICVPFPVYEKFITGDLATNIIINLVMFLVSMIIIEIPFLKEDIKIMNEISYSRCVSYTIAVIITEILIILVMNILANTIKVVYYIVIYSGAGFYGNEMRARKMK